MSRPTVLQISPFFAPNVGGVETHLNDLVRFLIKRDFRVLVLTYPPLSTKAKWKIYEKGKNLKIFRVPWIKGFFEKLVSFPVLEFIYLVPGLLFFAPFILIYYKPKTIHAHGLSATAVAVFWGKLFKTKVIVSLHITYAFPKTGLYHDFVKLLLRKADIILNLSKKSNHEVISLGVDTCKSKVFTYWVDLNRFKDKGSKSKIKKMLNWDKKFTALFVGRLIEEKGIRLLIKSAALWNERINLKIIGSGPMEEYVSEQAKKIKNIQFFGKVDQANLPLYYNGADCTIVPSISEEGFGRVIIESLACGTPVIASRRGAILEAMDETVGKFIEITPDNLKKTLEYFYKNPSKLVKLTKNSRNYAERRYSETNAETIIKTYLE